MILTTCPVWPWIDVLTRVTDLKLICPLWFKAVLACPSFTKKVLASTGSIWRVLACTPSPSRGSYMVKNGPVWRVLAGLSLSPFLTGRMFVRPNILRTLRRTMNRFLIELLVRRIWFGQSKLYFILNWLVMRCKLRPELAADAQQTAWSKM